MCAACVRFRQLESFYFTSSKLKRPGSHNYVLFFVNHIVSPGIIPGDTMWLTKKRLGNCSYIICLIAWLLQNPSRQYIKMKDTVIFSFELQLEQKDKNDVVWFWSTVQGFDMLHPSWNTCHTQQIRCISTICVLFGLMILYNLTKLYWSLSLLKPSVNCCTIDTLTIYV